MNEHTKYDPEDIEKLLRNKTFDELLEKERTFVYNHISSEEEYNQMRHLLMDLEDQEWEEAPDPPKSLRIDLINQHKKTNKKGFQVWLNSLFAADRNQLTWYQRPAFQLAIATVLVVGSVFFFTQKDSLDQPLAELHKEEKTKENSPSPLNEQAKKQTQNVIENESVSPVVPDLVEGNIEEPTLEPPVNSETENDLKSKLTTDGQNLDLIDEQLNQEDITRRRNTEKTKSDDSEISDDVPLSNTVVENKFVQDKDIASNAPKSDDSVIESSETISEIRNEALDNLTDIEAEEDDYLEEVQEAAVIQDVVGNTSSSRELSNESMADLDSKKEDGSAININNSVSLKEQSEIIDQLFTAH